MGMNTRITIEFNEGITREYTVNDKMEAWIRSGEEFNMTTCHPDVAEIMMVVTPKLENTP